MALSREVGGFDEHVIVIDPPRIVFPAGDALHALATSLKPRDTTGLADGLPFLKVIKESVGCQAPDFNIAIPHEELKAETFQEVDRLPVGRGKRHG